ncbi:HET-domain-containing protein [Hyaloscypha variabilis F]|uniref:HET-domain-containing protein n=1 Tax=Hyaloscypha variabilis (strain UAMH 11265 / GT02V1 / F) TaxID=1149755 RepID=A0A2J6RTQ3_HYAVF|nr:HET-domain-containing protein [Hyaloscypha variabilis F]
MDSNRIKKFLAKARRKIASKKDVLEPEKALALYRSLDRERREFRLLHLLPSENFTAPIRCKIFHSSLDKSPGYEALSYVWGNPNVTQDVLIHERSQAVTKNLELALRHIRLPKKKRILWVDALCIDQSHVIEKNHQVAQMRDIYLNSKRVVVWLGEEGSAQAAIKFCRKLKQKNFSISGMPNDQFQKNLEACHDLFIERAWWNRRWILQEVLHDRRVQVYIGKIEIAFDELCQYFEAYDSSKTVWKIKNATKEVMLKSKKELGGFSPINVLFAADRKPVERISHQRLMIAKRDEPSTSLQITLQNFRSQQCTDPRDGVYALLGMAALKYSIPIDYNATKRTIFTLTMHALLPTSPNPFLWVESPDRPILSSISETDLPSWVPDWTTQQTLFVQTMTAYSYFSSFDASRSRTNYMKYRPRAKIQTFDHNFMEGVYVGVVSAVHTAHIWEDSHRAPYDTIKLINYDRNPERRHVVIEDNAASLETPLERMAIPSWGPYWGKVGDIIVVARGSSTPLVLRKSGRHYLFVGACWLIDSELQGTGMPGQDDPGFSDIMRGALWDQIGKSCKLERFWLK